MALCGLHALQQSQHDASDVDLSRGWRRWWQRADGHGPGPGYDDCADGCRPCLTKVHRQRSLDGGSQGMTGDEGDGPLLLGLDLGSTNIKAVVYDRTGQALKVASTSQQTHYPQAGWAYYDPEEIWELSCRVIREAVASVERPDCITAIAVS